MNISQTLAALPSAYWSRTPSAEISPLRDCITSSTTILITYFGMLSSTCERWILQFMQRANSNSRRETKWMNYPYFISSSPCSISFKYFAHSLTKFVSLLFFRMKLSFSLKIYFTQKAFFFFTLIDRFWEKDEIRALSKLKTLRLNSVGTHKQTPNALKLFSFLSFGFEFVSLK